MNTNEIVQKILDEPGSDYEEGFKAGAAAEREECIKLCKWLADRYPESDASSCVDIISLRGKE